MRAAIFHLMSKCFTINHEVRDTVGSISDGVPEKIPFCDNMRIQQKKNVSNCDFSHNSAQHRKLNIFIVCYITNHYKVRDVFVKTPLFWKKQNVIFIMTEICYFP